MTLREQELIIQAIKDYTLPKKPELVIIFKSLSLSNQHRIIRIARKLGYNELPT